MTDIKKMLINKPAPDNLEKLLSPYSKEDEPFLFAVISDLTLEGKYGQVVFVATKKRFFVVDLENEAVLSYDINKDNELKVKRMYGNAYMYKTNELGKPEIILRFTFALASLMDMAARYVTNVADGKDQEEEQRIVEGTFEKLISVCPKCGRTLLRPGAECLHCSSKSRAFTKILKYVKPQWKNLLFCLFLTLIITFIEVVPPYTTKLIVDYILPNKDVKMLAYMVIAMFVLYVVHYGFVAWMGYRMRVSGNHIVFNLRNDLYEKAQHLPMRFYDKTPTGHVINRIGTDCMTVQNFILNITQQAVMQALLLVGIIAVMLVMNWRLTLISLIPVPFVVFISRTFGKKIAPYYRKMWRKWSSVTSILTDTIPCVRVIKAFSGEKRAAQRFERYNTEWLKTDLKAGKIVQIFPQVIAFLITIGSLAIWAIGGGWVIGETGEITAGVLVSFISYTSMFYTPVRYFASLSDSYQSVLSSLERIMDILDAEPESNAEDAKEVTRLKGEIEFRNVNFSFDKTKKVLSDVNFKIKQGDIVGIVGTTGSGKTTLINLLMRYYDDYEGEILVDGENIKNLDIQSYRGNIGYVQQEPMMFSDTIYNNIAYGNPDSSSEDVMNAADVANAHEFIIRQPDAYDSMLGERGVGLSGGERQRISIARAVLKNPGVLVFDEATASVDSETEELIQEAIDKLIHGRTTLMIAHRLSTLRKANKILVVDNGRIIEDGSHDELMAKKGKYYKLINIQTMAKTDDVVLK